MNNNNNNTTVVDDSMKYCCVTIGTCICWSKTGGGNNGRYKHLVQIQECDRLNDARKRLTTQRDALNETTSLDEKHRIAPVYEFVVASRNRYEHDDENTNKNNNRNNNHNNNNRNNDDENVRNNAKRQRNAPATITGSTRKPRPSIGTEQVMRALRIVSVPVYDPSIRRTCNDLKLRSKARHAFVVFVSDTDIRNWTNALRDYLVSDEDDNVNDDIDNDDNNNDDNNNDNDNNDNDNNNINTNNNSNVEPSSLSSSSWSPQEMLDLRDSCETIRSRLYEIF